MASRSLCSTMFRAVVLLIFGLLSTKAVSASTSTYPINWDLPPHLDVGELQQVHFAETSNNGKLQLAPPLNVGDSLHFEYDSKVYDLVEVNYEAFKRCDGSAPLRKWSDGDTKITLSKPGTFYYIGGHLGHCLAKQVMIVVVGKAVRPELTILASTIKTEEAPRRQLGSTNDSVASGRPYTDVGFECAWHKGECQCFGWGCPPSFLS